MANCNCVFNLIRASLYVMELHPIYLKSNPMNIRQLVLFYQSIPHVPIILIYHHNYVTLQLDILTPTCQIHIGIDIKWIWAGKKNCMKFHIYVIYFLFSTQDSFQMPYSWSQFEEKNMKVVIFTHWVLSEVPKTQQDSRKCQLPSLPSFNLQPNLAIASCGGLPLWLDHKIEKEKPQSWV